VFDHTDGNETAALFAGLSDVQIDTAAVPVRLEGATAEGVLWQAAPGRFLLRVPEVARFLVQAGRNVTIDREPGAVASDIRGFLHMTPLAALLYQRGRLALHAAAAANSEGAILLAGDSGTGKSTLLVALLKRGWTMLADEVAAVDLDRHGEIRVAPVFPEIRLWRNAREKSGKTTAHPAGSSSSSLWSQRQSDHGLTVSKVEQFAATPQPLRAICWLTAHNVDRIEVRVLEGMERFRALGTMTYNSHIADALQDRAEYLRQAAILARSVPILRLCRPRGKWTVEDLADQVGTAFGCATDRGQIEGESMQAGSMRAGE